MEKIKPIIKNCIENEKGKDILIIIVVILVGLGSFELGRLSKENPNKGLKIEYPVQNDQISANASKSTESVPNQPKTALNTVNKTVLIKKTEKSFFASKRGNKYYSLGCAGGKTIKQENKIYFSTREEAEKAGYELSSSCR